MRETYEMVIGLEVHVELKTASKIFCGCPTTFGAEPNTQCCPVCMGMPGTLPVLNRQVVEHAIRAGLATHCTIAPVSKMDRKNYFYPDLPKAYQISQYDLPLCLDGYLTIQTAAGAKRVGITRIHIEEDAGKLIHDPGQGTLIDCNRCGVPLIEIVSEPDLRSAEEARVYLQKLRAVMLYTGVSDCKMNEGSFRCDVNLSVRPAGSAHLGTRTEMKNLNSFQSVTRAIEQEYARQTRALEAGETIVQETRRFDQQTGKTFSMRSKENADDYRYFPEPDLPAIAYSPEMVAAIAKTIPVLPDARQADYQRRYGLPPATAEQLTLRREVADAFEAAVQGSAHPGLIANLIVGGIMPLLPDAIERFPVSPAHVARTAELAAQGRINSTTARRLMQALCQQDQDPEALIRQRGWEQISDRDALAALADEAVAENPKIAEDYRAGKGAALQALIGLMMKKTGGRGNPQLIREILTQRLE